MTRTTIDCHLGEDCTREKDILLNDDWMTLVQGRVDDHLHDLPLRNDFLLQLGCFFVLGFILGVLHCLTLRLPFISYGLDNIFEGY